MPSQKQSLESWARRYGVSEINADATRRLCELYFSAREHAVNGDYHSRAKDWRNKSACAEAWNAEAHSVAIQLNEQAASFGFDVCYRHGLYPTLTRGTETGIVIPFR